MAKPKPKPERPGTPPEATAPDPVTYPPEFWAWLTANGLADAAKATASQAADYFTLWQNQGSPTGTEDTTEKPDWAAKYPDEFWTWLQDNGLAAGAAGSEVQADNYYGIWAIQNPDAPALPDDTGGTGGGTEETPDQPPYAPAEGYEWVWDGTTWTQQRTAASRSALRDQFESYLDTYGQNTPGNVALLEQALANDWSVDKFLQEWRKSPDYLANPLFAANLERTKSGARFMTEGEVVTWRDEARRLSRQFGFQEPSDNYLAMGLLSGKSMAEFEHHFKVQKTVNQYGGGVALVYREIMGEDPSDQDLFEIFSDEHNTSEIDNAIRQAEYRGRPLTLGLGIRSEAEARAFEMMGVDPVTAFGRYESLAANASRFDRLRSIEDLITQGLPDDFGKDLAGATENSLLARAWLFKDPAAQAEWDQMVMREVARWKQGGGTSQGQLTDLLSDAEKASFG